MAHARDDIEAATHETKGLRQDNVSLYEKIRYLESYGGEPRRQANNDLEKGGVEQKYKALYEHKMNPFVAFETEERRRRYKNLNAAVREQRRATPVCKALCRSAS